MGLQNRAEAVPWSSEFAGLGWFRLPLLLGLSKFQRMCTPCGRRPRIPKTVGFELTKVMTFPPDVLFGRRVVVGLYLIRRAYRAVSKKQIPISATMQK
jgi:hypothetical protein